MLKVKKSKELNFRNLSLYYFVIVCEGVNKMDKNRNRNEKVWIIDEWKSMNDEWKSMIDEWKNMYNENKI